VKKSSIIIFITIKIIISIIIMSIISIISTSISISIFSFSKKKMKLLENNPFLSELEKLFDKSKTSGSVFITVKRYKPPVSKKKGETKKEETPDEQFPCLVRATNGKKIKFSTLVNPHDLLRFQSNYMGVLKLKTVLKKQKREKSKSKAKDKPKEKKLPTSTTAAPADQKTSGK